MNFIEQWFGISPDGGDGSLEFFWIAALAIAAVAWLMRGRLRDWLLRRRR